MQFDLVICDEAHRTTGVTLAGEDDSNFVRVHDDEYIHAKKRLYMTATPRIYAGASKQKAKDNSALLCSMDDESIYGPEFYRLSFSDAVSQGLLSDYKVVVLAVDEEFVSRSLQKQLTDSNNELTLDDAVKIVGCMNGLAKKTHFPGEENYFSNDPQPMRRAVAFTQTIEQSKKFVAMFEEIQALYKINTNDGRNHTVELKHVDGSFNALERKNRIEWLKQDTGEDSCRVLSNARCLSEGVDVPALDAVMFLNPRKSIVDIIQSVGRVMRKSEGKQYGYIILPIGIPAGVEPEVALGVTIEMHKEDYTVVDRMRFGKGKDKSIIEYNPYITIRNIPAEAYNYIVNGKSAIEWILEQYAVTTDKASGIVNDPNTYAGGKYIFDLLLSIISVSLKTQELIAQLPEYKEI